MSLTDPEDGPLLPIPLAVSPDLREEPYLMSTLTPPQHSQGSFAMTDAPTAPAADTTVLTSFSEVQLLEALRSKSRQRRDELKEKIMDLRSQLHRAEEELARIAADDAQALALVRGE